MLDKLVFRGAGTISETSFEKMKIVILSVKNVSFLYSCKKYLLSFQFSTTVIKWGPNTSGRVGKLFQQLINWGGALFATRETQPCQLRYLEKREMEIDDKTIRQPEQQHTLEIREQL